MYYAKFQELCTIKGVRPADVSRATGISTATMTSWKQGKYTPKMDKLQKVADYFGVSIDYLTSGDSSQPDGYYVYGETAEVANEILKNSDMRLLFDAARGSDPDALRMAAAMLRKMKGNGE